MKLLSPIVDNKDLVNKEYVDTNATSTSVLPNDNGEIKTKYRISNKSNTSTGTWYYPLCKLPKDDSGNYASAIISGRIGGWVNSNMSSISALAWNRNGTGISLLDIAGGATNMNNIWSICDIVIYTDASSVSPSSADDGIDIIYLKCHSYFTFDLNVELFQSTAVFMYDGTYLTQEPSGTLVAQASTSDKRVEVVNGKLYVAGNEVATSANIVTGVKGDSESTYRIGNVNITKANIGLGNVGNFKAVSTVASQGLTDTEKANARANIGAGTSSLTLGTTSSTAYRGDYGNTAYTHATDSSRLTTAKTSGLYKVASTSEGHIASLTAVEKSDITALGIPGSDTNTTYTLSADTTNNKVVLTPSSGTAQSITVPYATKSGSADKLTTARTIGIGTGGTGTATSFDGSGNITIPLTDVKDSYISWGGKGLTNNGLSPGDMGCIDEFGHNKLAYLDPVCLDVAYSTDGGTTWIDSGLTDAQKIRMMTTSGPMTYSGGSTVATAENITQLKLRIRLACGTTSGTGKIYTAAKKILFNVTDPNANATMTMRYRTIANYKSDTDTWVDVPGTYDVRGGAGWNSIPFVYTFGGNMSTQTTQIGQFEFVFSNTKLGNWGQNKVGVGDIRLIGASNWTMPSELARAGHIYSLDENQNAIFPRNILVGTNNSYNLGSSSYKWANVYATNLNGQLVGTISSNTTATTQASGDNSTKVATTAFVTSAIGTVQTPIYSGPTAPSDTSKIWYDTTTNTFMYYDQTSEDWEESNSPDVMSEVLRITGDLQNQINNMDDTVGELQVESATHITQTDAETLVNASASSLSADIQTAYDTLDNRITSLNSNLSTSIQAVDNKYDGYIDIANKGSTDPTLSLSTPTSNLSINTTNSNIKIKSGTNDIVTVNSDKLSSTHLEATETLGMGNFGWVVQTSGHVTLKKLT